MNQDPTPDVTVYYNGACPVCRWERDFHGSRDQACKIAWVDITEQPEVLATLGVSEATALQRLHAVDATGRTLVGVSAFQAIWAAVPGSRWAARLVDRIPPLKWGLSVVYNRVIAPVIYRWELNRRRTQRRDPPATVLAAPGPGATPGDRGAGPPANG
jgi:predicted DCC family thiol-disulfide oxidoreductase YuxK